MHKQHALATCTNNMHKQYAQTICTSNLHKQYAQNNIHISDIHINNIHISNIHKATYTSNMHKQHAQNNTHKQYAQAKYTNQHRSSYISNMPKQHAQNNIIYKQHTQAISTSGLVPDFDIFDNISCARLISVTVAAGKQDDMGKSAGNNETETMGWKNEEKTMRRKRC